MSERDYPESYADAHQALSRSKPTALTSGEAHQLQAITGRLVREAISGHGVAGR